MALTKVKVLVDNTEYVDNLYSVNWEQPHLNLSDVPQFEFNTDNFHGRNYNTHAIGKDVKIYRNGGLEFYGVIEPKSFSKGAGGASVNVKGKHKGYLNMQKSICEGYRVTEGFVNPWQWGRKDVSGNEIDGINPSDIFKNLIGTKFTFQEFFDNTKAILSTDASGARGYISLAIVDIESQGNTKLMAAQSGTGFTLGSGTTPGQAHSIPLYNTPIITASGGQVIRQMGEIQSVTIKLFGDYLYTPSAPLLWVCRDGGDAIVDRNYVSVPISLSSGSVGQTNVMWTGSVTFTGSEGHKNKFAYKLQPNGTATGTSATTNKIDYLRIDCTTLSDIGLTEGTITSYTDPTSSSGNNVVVNVLGLNRLEAAERVRKMTITPDSITDSPHWDAWVDNDLKFHFVQRRGTAVSDEYSFAKYNITDIKHNFDANNLVNNVIAKGQGAPPNQTTIISDALVDYASVLKYGSRQGVFQDTSIKDITTLQRRAKAYLKLYKEPIETVDVSIINDWKKVWAVGDTIVVKDSDIGVDGAWRIISAKHKVRGEGNELIDVELGNKSYKAKDLFGGIGQALKDQEIFYQGIAASAVTSTTSVPFDKDKPAVYSFIIPENVDVDRVYIYAKTDVFKTTSKSASAGGGGTTSTEASQIVTSDASSITTTFAEGSHKHKVFEQNAAIDRVFDNPMNDTIWRNIRIADVNGNWGSMWVRVPSGLTTGPDLYDWENAGNHTHGMSHTHTLNIPSHSHSVSAHTHPLVFGIYEFSGDATTFGAPMYPTKIQMFVDKLPADAGAVALESWGLVGKASGAVSVDKLDITSALRNASGKIVPGLHFLSFKPSSSQAQEAGMNDSNVQNLGQIYVNHFISFNTKGTTE